MNIVIEATSPKGRFSGHFPNFSKSCGLVLKLLSVHICINQTLEPHCNFFISMSCPFIPLGAEIDFCRLFCRLFCVLDLEKLGTSAENLPSMRCSLYLYISPYTIFADSMECSPDLHIVAGQTLYLFGSSTHGECLFFGPI